MNELYWITRFDGINNVINIFLVISAIASALFITVYIVNYCEEQNCSAECCKQECKNYQKLGIRFLKITIPIFIVSCLGVVFVPTTKQALLIYGVGGTIDYVKTNPTAKQLPDKCIKALDGWVDSWNIEKNDSTKKK